MNPTMRTSATIQRYAWLLLSIFMVGTVVVPVVHHSFHPHGVEDLQAAPADESALAAATQTKTAIGCVICNTPAAADGTPALKLFVRLPVDSPAPRCEIRFAHVSDTSLSARAPPVA